VRHTDGAFRVRPLLRDLGGPDRLAARGSRAATPAGLLGLIARLRITPLNDEAGYDPV
jgi:hypothetical protein